MAAALLIDDVDVPVRPDVDEKPAGALEETQEGTLGGLRAAQGAGDKQRCAERREHEHEGLGNPAPLHDAA